ncbi:uromodulin-like 1 [Mugil cephalus]|uniref:uromodulin-like 1 n=1 Tax=Mugil cephalus TaxID=48193 RepID=UPI001FB7EC9B|nr:uromodulin-like 1 [Mugil cephalus]
MSWMLSVWMSAALLALCGGQNSEQQEVHLAPSGYHLCIRNETRTVSFLVVQMVPYTVSKPCGGWLFWKTCTVTLHKLVHQTEHKTVNEQVARCCDGFVQVGRYCALPVNRSGEFVAKPGSCPTADGFSSSSEACVLDIDCPGWQKCCQRSGHCLCTDPASSNDFESGGNILNATVMVKEDYKQLMTKDDGLLDHARLLQAMVTGALQSEVSIRYLDSWPVHPYRTATSLLIDCNFTLSLHNVTSRLSLLLTHIDEVTSVTVEDLDECAHSALHQCSPLAHCVNTVGSYHCVCRGGYTDADPGNPGANCTGFNISVTTEAPLTHLPLTMNTTCAPESNTTRDLPGNSTTGLFNSSESNTATSLTSPPSSWTRPVTQTNASSTEEAPLPATTCPPPSINMLQPANVTGTSFCVYWSGQFHPNQTYLVEIRKGSEVVLSLETNQTRIEKKNLQPGMLYNVTVTPCACGSQGVALHISIRTDAQTVDGTARLTNIQFTEDLQNTSSQAYRNLTESFIHEIYRSLSPEMRALVDSGQVTIEIKSISMGSVVVNFIIILSSGQSQDIRNVSTALLHSLMNSPVYTVDANSTSINDVNECASGDNDCHPWARCTNTFGSYTCDCLDGYMDNNPERPGRVCQAIAALETTTTAVATAIFPTVSSSTVSQMTSTSEPSTSQSIVTQSTPGFATTAATVALATSSTTTITTTIPTTTSITPTTITTTPTTTTTTSTTTTATQTTTTTTPTTTITATPTITTTTPTTTGTTTPTITTTTTPTTTATTTPTITTTTPTTNATTTPTITTTTPTTTTTTTPSSFTNPVITATSTTISTTLATTSANTTTTATPPSTSPMITSTPTTTSTTATPPSSTSPMITSTPTATSTSTTPTPSTSPATTTTPLTTSTTTTTTASQRSATNTSIQWALSVQCKVGAITVAVAKDFLTRAHIQESALYLGMQDCVVNGGNATHVELTVAWDECNITLVHNETSYTASIMLFNTVDPYTSTSGSVPRTLLQVPIMCTYMKNMLISADFSSMGYDMIKDVIMGSGSFQVVVQLMNGTVPLPYNYTLSPKEAVVVEVRLNVSSEQIKLIISKCWATESPNPADTPPYIFLENSCSTNSYTTVLMNGNSTTSRVSVKIFSFVDLNVLYLHCKVQICLQIGSDSCVPDCLQRTARFPNTIGAALGSSGPVLRSAEESFEEKFNTLHIVGLSCLGVGLSLFFIIGFVCLFYYQRNRIGHYNFSVKPKQENFTYLVFNT